MLHHPGRIYFNPQGSREPRLPDGWNNVNPQKFQSTRLSRASTWTTVAKSGNEVVFQSTRLSRASTHVIWFGLTWNYISIHKALASLDNKLITHFQNKENFNPQGSREPRPVPVTLVLMARQISIHKALASLDCHLGAAPLLEEYFNPQGSREPRHNFTVLCKD